MITQPACEGVGGLYLGDASTCGASTCTTGACCDPNGDCTETDAGDCTGQGGLYQGDGTLCEEVFCPASGHDCGDPVVVSVPAGLPFVDENHTAGRGDDYSATCLDDFDGDEDMIYRLDVSQSMCLEISLDGCPYMGFVIDDVCPPGDPCLASSISAAGLASDLVLVNAGTYFIMVDSWDRASCDAFTLSIDQCPPTPSKSSCLFATPIGETTDLVFDTTASSVAADGDCPFDLKER